MPLFLGVRGEVGAGSEGGERETDTRTHRDRGRRERERERETDEVGVPPSMASFLIF